MDDASRPSADAVNTSAEQVPDLAAQSLAATEAVANLQEQLGLAKSLIAEVTSLHSNAQATSNQTLEVKAQAAAAFQSLQSLVSTATENANRVEAIKTGAEQAQGVIATKSQHIEDGRIHADKVRADIDRLLTEAQQSSTNAEAQHQASRSASENLNSLYASAQTVKANTDSNAEAVAKSRQQCEEHEAKTRKLAEIADTSEEKVSAYEARLAQLEQTAAERLKTIEGLLPGAASAGLASAFNQRRGHYEFPQRLWQSVFVITVLGLFVLAGLHAGPNGLEYGLLPKADAALTWDHLGLSLLYRLPFALPLIWLAFHASHKAALAQRVEEDYAFKETVSRSFEGYRREMAELEGKAAPQSPLSRLCTGVLSVITNPPGRIYEKHPLNKTPLNAVAESVAPLADAASRMTTATLKVEK